MVPDNAIKEAAQSTRAIHYVHRAWSIYRQDFWLVLKLILPAALISFFITCLLADKMAELAHYVPSHLGNPIPPFLLVEVGLFRMGGFLTTWIGYCFSFAAICVAVSKIKMGGSPVAAECFTAVRERFIPFLKISVLLFLVLILTSIVFVVVGAFIQAQYVNKIISLPAWMAYQSGAFLFFVSCVIVSRFSLSHPSVILEGTNILSSLFRSDELTEGKWFGLALLVFEGTLAPFYLAQAVFWMLQSAGVLVPLPAWSHSGVYYLVVALSIAMEPIMFIGFAIMYLEASQESHQRQLAVSSSRQI